MNYTLSFPPPAGMLNMNQRGHWGKWHETKVAWRDAGQIHGRNAINSRRIPMHLPFSVIEFTFPVASLKIRRDPHNFAPTLKAIIDGLVLAKIFDDDDGHHLATTEPRFHDVVMNPNVVVSISTKEDPCIHR